MDQDPNWVKAHADKEAISLSIKGHFSWGFSGGDGEKKKRAAREESTAETDRSPKKELTKFMTLKHIELSVQRGEFICIIGDVGAGKSSLLNAIIGDLIYVPEEKIEELGGLDIDTGDIDVE